MFQTFCFNHIITDMTFLYIKYSYKVLRINVNSSMRSFQAKAKFCEHLKLRFEIMVTMLELLF